VGYAFFLLSRAWRFTLLPSIGAVAGDEQALLVLSLVGASVGGLLVALAVPGMAASFGLLAHKVWGRYLAIVVAILRLINFPIGTLSVHPGVVHVPLAHHGGMKMEQGAVTLSSCHLVIFRGVVHVPFGTPAGG
jgi:hypothetical protein